MSERPCKPERDSDEWQNHQRIMKECDGVDWDMITDYLAQCQSTNPAKMSATKHERNEHHEHVLCTPFPLSHSAPLPTQIDLIRRAGPLSTAAIPISTTAQSTPSTTASPSDSGLSTGAKAGIAGGVAIGVVVLLATLVTFHTRRRRRQYGYFRTKGKDDMAAELEGHFVVTTWPDHREGSPGMNLGYGRRQSEVSLGQTLSGETQYGHDDNRNRSELHSQYIVSPEMPPTARMHEHNIHGPTPQPYQPSPLLNNSPSPEVDPYEQHNQRARPSHPLSLLSEAIPPPKLKAREVHSMADYQNAVPLGFANGFVQVGSRRGSEDTIEHQRTWDSIQPSYELDLGERFNHARDGEEADAGRGLIQAAEEDGVLDEEERRADEDVIERTEGDTELPEYEEMPGVKQQASEIADKNRNVRENVRWDQATGHYHIDVESDDDGEGTSRGRELSKEDLG